jgi:hypothetical protein
MKLLTKEIRERLLKNGRLQSAVKGTDAELDFLPVVKLFTPDGACTWLLTELDPDDPDIAFGLCDLGMGCPELGSVSIAELERGRGRMNLPVERDMYFAPERTISDYAADARKRGRIEA